MSSKLLSDPTSIGNVLVRLKKITPEQLAEAAQRKVAFDEYVLSAILKEMGAVNDADVALALKVQTQLRSGQKLDAELTVLESKVEEAQAGAVTLAGNIRRLRRKRRERGEDSQVFLIPAGLRLARAQ